MNAVEIEQAVSALAEQPFDPAEFPFSFLQAFGNKETTLKRLRSGETNRCDLGGVLQRSHIHIAVAAPGEVMKTLAALKASPATTRAKAKFILATDGDIVRRWRHLLSRHVYRRSAAVRRARRQRAGAGLARHRLLRAPAKFRLAVV